MSDFNLTRRLPYVYFIQSGESGPVKIGSTTDHPLKRLKMLQTGTHEELRLIGVIDHPKSDHKELVLHRRFKSLWIRGEWFRPEEELMIFIRENSEPTFFATIPKEPKPPGVIRRRRIVEEIRRVLKNKES